MEILNYFVSNKFFLIFFRCIDVFFFVESSEEKGGVLEDKEENVNEKERELIKGENNREEVESGNDKFMLEFIVCLEYIELVKIIE